MVLMGKDTASCFICSYHQQHASCHQYCHLLFKDVWRYLKDINSPTGRSRGHVSGTCAKASFTLLPPFSGNGSFYFCKEEGIWKTSYWNILQNGLWAVAGEFWIPGSWVSHYLGTTHTLYVLPRLYVVFMIQNSPQAGMQVWITEMSLGYSSPDFLLH